jgi:hypothetical protein
MRQIHSLPEHARAQPGRILRRLSEQTLKDWRYIWRMQTSVTAKVRWMLYAPLWHLATEAGIHAGSRAEKLPIWLVGWLSRQSQLLDR